MTTFDDAVKWLDSTCVHLQSDVHHDDANLHRPDLRVWCSNDDDHGYVVMTVGAMWGQPQRYIELVPAKARELANHLLAMAQQVEALQKQYVDSPRDEDREALDDVARYEERG